MLKILHILYDHINNPWIGGGGAVRTFEIYKRLKNKNYNITIVSGNYPNAINNLEYNLKQVFLGNSRNYYISVFSYAYEVNRFLNKNYKKFDIVIEDFAPWNPIFSYKYQKKIPVILQLHHLEGINILKKYFIAGIPFFFIERNYTKKFLNIVAVSKTTKIKFKIKKAQIIPNGIDKSLLKYKTIMGDYLLFIGRIDFYNKGIDILVKACENKKLIIIGKGKDEKKIKEYQSKNNINYLGFLEEDDKLIYIKNSRFLVMPSRFEGQGIVALESAALGKPLIVSDIPELSYVVKNGFGISFKSGNWRDLKEKIEFLWNNDKLIFEMGEKAREYAKDFTWDKIAEQYAYYLQKVYKNFYKTR